MEAIEIRVGEEIHNVFPGNTFSSNELPFSSEIVSEQVEVNTITQPQIYTRTTNSFKSRMVPFSRTKEALKLVEQEIDNFKEEERSQLKQTLEELEQSLAQLKAKQ